MKKLSTTDEQRLEILVRALKQRQEEEAENHLDQAELLVQIEEQIEPASQEEWGAFCETHFGFGPRRANQLVKELRRHQDSGTAVPTERHGRYLGQLPPELQREVMLILGDDATSDEVKAFVEKVKDLVLAGADVRAELAKERVSRSEAKAKKDAETRRQTKEERAIGGLRKKLNQVHVRPVADVNAALTSSKRVVGLVDLDRLEPILEEMRRPANELADLAGQALKILAESSGEIQSAKAA